MSMVLGENRRVADHSLLANFGSLVDGLSGEIFDRSKIESLITAKKKKLNDRIRGGDFVLFKMSNQVDFFADLFACWELRLIPVIVPHRSHSDEIKNVGEFFSVRAIFSDRGVELNNQSQKLGFDLTAADRESTALVLLTSGSLGKPKAIFLSFSALKEKFSALEEVIPLKERENTMCFLPLCFGHGLICNALFPLLTGSTLYIFPAFELQMTAEYLKAISKYQIHFFSTVPVILKVLLQNPLPAHQLRRVHCASAPLPLRDWQAADRWLGNGVSVTHVYGLTEFSGWVAGSDSLEHRTQGYVGRPWGTQVKIEEEQVYLRGAGCMSGWVENNKFHPVNREAWMATGDLGTLDPRGCLTLKGRQKDIINYGGFKINPDDLEQLLSQHPLIKEV